MLMYDSGALESNTNNISLKILKIFAENESKYQLTANFHSFIAHFWVNIGQTCTSIGLILSCKTPMNSTDASETVAHIIS